MATLVQALTQILGRPPEPSDYINEAVMKQAEAYMETNKEVQIRQTKFVEGQKPADIEKARTPLPPESSLPRV